MNLKKLFLILTIFSRAGALDVTHFQVDINCHINPAISFSTQNESHHFYWCDTSMSRATSFCVTHFWSKSVKSNFLII
jgi:hypothetical protein